MSLDLLIVLVLSVLALLAHGAKRHPWLGWIMRVLIGVVFSGELVAVATWALTDSSHAWALGLTATLAALTGLILFEPVRRGFAYLFCGLEQVISGPVWAALAKRSPVLPLLKAPMIFSSVSIPHMVALWIYLSSIAFLLGSIEPSTFQLPALPIPFPVPIDQLFSYNGLGLVMLAACGVGIFVSRSLKETAHRLGWAKPTLSQVGIGVLLILMTLGYDALWALYTHNSGQGLADKLAGYNSGTFTMGGGLGGSLILALATSLCAGIGEETLIRGALQPVIGILPAAILHGLLHGQFSHAPVFIIQVALWSMIMGIVKRYTNTTTTIIGHAGFNFITTFLFAFNP